MCNQCTFSNTLCVFNLNFSHSMKGSCIQARGSSTVQDLPCYQAFSHSGPPIEDTIFLSWHPPSLKPPCEPVSLPHHTVNFSITMTNPYTYLYFLVLKIVPETKWMVCIVLFFKRTSEIYDRT